MYIYASMYMGIMFVCMYVCMHVCMYVCGCDLYVLFMVLLPFVCNIVLM